MTVKQKVIKQIDTYRDFVHYDKRSLKKAIHDDNDYEISYHQNELEWWYKQLNKLIKTLDDMVYFNIISIKEYEELLEMASDVMYECC